MSAVFAGTKVAGGHATPGGVSWLGLWSARNQNVRTSDSYMTPCIPSPVQMETMKSLLEGVAACFPNNAEMYRGECAEFVGDRYRCSGVFFQAKSTCMQCMLCLGVFNLNVCSFKLKV